ncbi:MAG: hypothetical protein M3O25_09320 [Actinomycetota bacterium]|nr:hypothetical protein [Actinomycetota bacterium]
MTESSEQQRAEPHLVELAAAADHARRRHDLYKAKTYGPKLTSPERLRELKRESERAASSLDRARADQRVKTDEIEHASA